MVRWEKKMELICPTWLTLAEREKGIFGERRKKRGGEEEERGSRLIAEMKVITIFAK